MLVLLGVRGQVGDLVLLPPLALDGVARAGPVGVVLGLRLGQPVAGVGLQVRSLEQTDNYSCAKIIIYSIMLIICKMRRLTKRGHCSRKITSTFAHLHVHDVDLLPPPDCVLAGQAVEGVFVCHQVLKRKNEDVNFSS